MIEDNSNIGIVGNSKIEDKPNLFLSNGKLYCNDGESKLVKDTNDGSRALYYQEAVNIIEDHCIKTIFSNIYTIDNDELKTMSTNVNFIPIFDAYHTDGNKVDNITENNKSELLEFSKAFSQHNEKQNEINYYDSCISKFNVNNYSVTFDVFKPNSDIYTSQLNLNSLYNISKVKCEKLTAIADLNIQYSTFTNKSKIFDVNTFLEIFSNGERVNIVQELNNDINLNYINGQLSVVPLNLNVLECIIAKCTITYGKL